MIERVIVSMLCAGFPDGSALAVRSASETAKIILSLLKVCRETFSIKLVMLEYEDVSALDDYGRRVNKSFLSEAFCWMLSKGLIARDFDASDQEIYFVTRSGAEISENFNFDLQVRMRNFPYEFLHQAVEEVARTHLERGDFNVAVSETYKYIEDLMASLAVEARYEEEKSMRAKCNYIMKKKGESAKNVGDGDALALLMNGSFTYFRNRVSHGQRGLSYEEAFDALIIASSFLRGSDTLEQKAGYERPEMRILSQFVG